MKSIHVTAPGQVESNPFSIGSGLVLLALLLTAVTLSASDDFIHLKNKFPSKAMSAPLHEAVIDYGTGIKIILHEGRLFCRRDRIGPDYYFIGEGEVVLADFVGLTADGQKRFGENRSVRFETAYICGRQFPEGFGLDSGVFHEDKIKRPNWNKLQFLLKAPHKYFGLDLGAELGLWSEKEILPLPVWIDLQPENGDQMVFYLSPDISEQLHVYVYENKYEDPYLIGGYILGDRVVSKPVGIDSTEIFIHLKESGKFDARSDIYFTENGLDKVYRRGLKLNLPFLFTVDSVQDVSGNNLPFVKKDRRGNLYILRHEYGRPENDPVIVYYRGKYLRSPYAGVDMPVNMTGWFPHLPHRNLGRYNLHYTLRRDLALISVGEKTGETVSGDQKTVSYRTGDRISYVSFATGKYDTLVETVNDIPLTLYVRSENNLGLFNRHIPRDVMADLSGAYGLFYERFGPALAKSLDIVDRAAFTGQSSPGLIHLSQISFHTSRDQARFRAHEVAHQWWGHTAVPRSYRDMWLSEGLAEFSAAMYLLDQLRDTTAYLKLVETWRKQILEEGKINGAYSRGFAAGSILQGLRLLESFSPGDYIALVYSKAAYLLQMLRFEIDGPSYKTDFFSAMLAKYCRTYYGEQATSEDFARVAGDYIGVERARTFFDQWLYGWDVPGFKCDYRITTDNRGRNMLDIDIRVTDVGDSFETAFPVELEFTDGSRRLLRLDGIGRKVHHRLGPFPVTIAEIRFDPGRIVLARKIEVNEKQ